MTMTTKAKKLPAKAKVPAEFAEAFKIDKEKGKARTNLSSAINAAAVIEAYSKSVFGDAQGGLTYVYEELADSINRVWDGDMKKCEGMLLAQASALQSIFTCLTRRAINQEGLAQFDTHLRLGLKAQAQAVRTIEALAEMKNPRSVAFVKQTNIANNQQVNNGQVSRTGEDENEQSKQAGETYELLPDTRASQVDGRISPALEAVGEKHRAEITRGESHGIEERR
jgi:hypothetical protein